MAEHQFTVTYDGPALEHHLMPVRDLAPALLALADAVKVASRVVAPTAAPPTLAISATEGGSFKVLLSVVDAGWFQKLVDALNGPETTAVVNGAELVGVVIGTFGGIKWLWKHRIRRIERNTPAPGMSRIVRDDDVTLDVPDETVTLIQDQDFRRSARAAAEPLTSDGIDTFSVTSQDRAISIDRSEVHAFDMPELADQVITETEYRAVLRLVSITFREGNKWKFSDGDSQFWAPVADLAFLDRVARNEETFTSGDRLVVTLRVQQVESNDGMRVDRTVVQVHEHRPGTRQVPLPFDQGAPED